MVFFCKSGLAQREKRLAIQFERLSVFLSFFGIQFEKKRLIFFEFIYQYVVALCVNTVMQFCAFDREFQITCRRSYEFILKLYSCVHISIQYQTKTLIKYSIYSGELKFFIQHLDWFYNYTITTIVSCINKLRLTVMIFKNTIFLLTRLFFFYFPLAALSFLVNNYVLLLRFYT